MKDTTVGALAHTSNQMWSSKLEFIAFNDSPPSNTTEPEPDSEDTVEADPNASTGHTKGFIAWSTTLGTGFWLTHSAPQFPLTPEQASSFQGLGDNAYTYGQHLLCVSMTMDELNVLAGQLIQNQPDVYSTFVSTTTKNNYPNIRSLALKSYPTAAKCTTASIREYVVLAKTAAWGKDLWSSCVATTFNAGLLAETWLRGLEIGPACPPTFAYETLDVVTLSFAAINTTFVWKETQDHSKWAIGLTDPVLCFGDINRMTSQYSRGGGATCFENKALWSQMRSAVTSHDTCP